MIIRLPLNTGEEYPIVRRRLDDWSTTYPAVDVAQELREMRAWCDANPKKRKTRGGILRFVTSWLAKAQDRGPQQTRPRLYAQHGVVVRDNELHEFAELRALVEQDRTVQHRVVVIRREDGHRLWHYGAPRSSYPPGYVIQHAGRETGT